MDAAGGRPGPRGAGPLRSLNGIFASPPRQHPPQRPLLTQGSFLPPSAAQQPCWNAPAPGGARRRAAWTCGAGWDKVAPQGCPGAKASGRATWEDVEATEFLSLPIHPEMTDAQVEEVSAAVRTFFEETG